MAVIKITLKAARVNAEMTLLQASKALGIGKDTLIKWEKNSGSVTPDRQEIISNVYGIPIDNIFFGRRLESYSSTTTKDDSSMPPKSA